MILKNGTSIRESSVLQSTKPNRIGDMESKITIVNESIEVYLQFLRFGL